MYGWAIGRLDMLAWGKEDVQQRTAMQQGDDRQKELKATTLYSPYVYMYDDVGNACKLPHPTACTDKHKMHTYCHTNHSRLTTTFAIVEVVVCPPISLPEKTLLLSILQWYAPELFTCGFTCV